MADSGGDYFPETEDFDISQIILIQAVLRGALVRKWMKEVKQAFEDAFIEIEKNSAIGVEWNMDQVCKPKVVRTRDRQKNERKKKMADVQSKIQKNDSKGHNTTISKSKNVKHGQDELNLRDVPVEKVTMVVEISEESDGSIGEILDTVKDSPKYNSVEIQTSFIDINFQNVPNKLKPESDDCNDQDNNILEDLDTSWKDRVEPFIRNNFDEAENLAEPNKDTPTADELRLDLDIDAESLQSQRSQRSSQKSSKNSERYEDSEILTAKSDGDTRSPESASIKKLSKIETEKGERDARRSSRSGKSERSRSSSVRKYNQDDEVIYTGQRSNRSDDYSLESQRTISKRSPEYIEKGELSDRKSDQSDKRSERSGLSNRSDKSQRLYETERFSPRGQRSGTSQNSDSRSQRSKGSEKGSEGQLTHRSESRRQNSHRSGGSSSHRSDKSDDRKSQRSQRSRQGEGQRSERIEQVEKMHPQQSRASPVQFQHSGKDPSNEESSRQGRPPLQDSTSLTNVTSVWDSFNSVRESHDIEMPKPLPQDASQLKELRKNIAMELLWVQQAIDSRKNYLKLKGQM